MSWGTEIPCYRNSDDHERAMLQGPPGTLIEGVLLNSEEAIAVMSIVASFDVINRHYHEIDGFTEIMDRYPESVEAGQQIADLYRSLRRVAGPGNIVPPFFTMIDGVLVDPLLTWDSLRSQLLSQMTGIAPVFNHVDQVEDNMPVQANANEDSVAEGAVAPSSSSRLPFSLTTVIAREARPDDPPEDIPGPLIFVKRQITKWKDNPGAWNAPPIGGPWEFMPGTDTSMATVGKPEPHKFFLTRQKVRNPSKKDVRQYPGWDTLDW